MNRTIIASFLLMLVGFASSAPVPKPSRGQSVLRAVVVPIHHNDPYGFLSHPRRMTKKSSTFPPVSYNTLEKGTHVPKHHKWTKKTKAPTVGVNHQRLKAPVSTKAPTPSASILTFPIAPVPKLLDPTFHHEEGTGETLFENPFGEDSEETVTATVPSSSDSADNNDSTAPTEERVLPQANQSSPSSAPTTTTTEPSSKAGFKTDAPSTAASKTDSPDSKSEAKFDILDTSTGQPSRIDLNLPFGFFIVVGIAAFSTVMSLSVRREARRSQAPQEGEEGQFVNR